MNIYLKGSQKSQNIAITFDDGPHPRHTLQLLEILDTWGAKATFFMTGNNVKKNKSLVSDVFKQGHEIGCHTLNHQKLLFSFSQKILYEIKTSKDLIENITGKKITLYRPPFGLISPFLFQVCKKLSLKIILWNVNSHDYRREDYPVITQRVSKKIKPGSIILFHECHYDDASLDYTNTIKAIQHILVEANFEKVKPATITGLLQF